MHANVLVVAPDIRAALRRGEVLAEAGCAVTFATSADAACQALSSDRLDVVLLDNSVAGLQPVAAKCKERHCTVLLTGCKPNGAGLVSSADQLKCVGEQDIVSGVERAIEERSRS